MRDRKMKKYRTLLCLVSAFIMVLCLTASAFAYEAQMNEVEEVIDAVAQKEAELAAAAAKAAAEAEKVNDVIDLDSAPDDEAVELISSEAALIPVENDSFSVPGPILAFIVAGILIICGVLIIAASNRKIRAGRQAT